MSAESDMIAACTAAEEAAVALATAYTNYQAAYRSAASAIDMSAPNGLARLGEFEHVIGSERLAQFVHGRLIALGAQRVVEQPGAMVPSGPEWVAYLTDKITANVP